MQEEEASVERRGSVEVTEQILGGKVTEIRIPDGLGELCLEQVRKVSGMFKVKCMIGKKKCVSRIWEGAAS